MDPFRPGNNTCLLESSSSRMTARFDYSPDWHRRQAACLMKAEKGSNATKVLVLI